MCRSRSFGDLLLMLVVAIGLLRGLDYAGLPEWLAACIAALAALLIDRAATSVRGGSSAAAGR